MGTREGYLETDGDESKAMEEDVEEENLTMLGDSPMAVGGGVTAFYQTL